MSISLGQLLSEKGSSLSGNASSLMQNLSKKMLLKRLDLRRWCPRVRK